MPTDQHDDSPLQQRLQILHHRFRILTARRVHYKRRLRILAGQRSRLAISKEDWMEASERIVTHLERVDRDLDQVDESLQALAAHSRVP